MSDVKWIKIVTDIFNNRKIKQIETMPDADSILVIWFKLLCLAGNINENGLLVITRDIPYTEEMLANEFRRPLNTVRLALDVFEKFDMIEIVDNVLCVSNWEKYQSVETLEKIREQTKLRVQKHRENQKLLCNVTSNATVTQSNATEEEQDKDIYSVFFEQIWQLYPNKKGKSSVSPTKKKELYKIGLEEMTRAIDRYKKETAGKEIEFIKHGSTFFKKGYLDYLDSNYEEKKTEYDRAPEGW